MYRLIQFDRLDGTRGMLVKDAEGNPFIWNRRNEEYYRIGHLPELNRLVEKFPVDTMVDVEIGSLKDGKVHRITTQKRCSKKTKDYVWKNRVEKSPVQAYAFDILRLRGKNLEALPLLDRKGILKDFVGEMAEPALQLVWYRRKGFADFFKEENEGIMGKKIWSRYLHMDGKTSSANRPKYWWKCKHSLVRLATVIGYLANGTGKRADTWRSLVLEADGKYIGKVGGGFEDAEVERIDKLLKSVPQRTDLIRYNDNKLVFTRAETGLKIRVFAHELTPNGILFQPKKLEILYP